MTFPPEPSEEPPDTIPSAPLIPDRWLPLPVATFSPPQPSPVVPAAWQPQPYMPPRPPQPPPQAPASYWVQPARKERRISRFRSGRRRVRIAAVLLAIATCFAIVQAIHYFDGLLFVQRARGGFVTIGQGLEFDDVTLHLAWVGIGIGLITGVAFLAWLSRAVDNLGPLGLTDPDPPASPRAAIAWWFVPFANYVMPYFIVADLQRRLVRQSLERMIVLIWWIAWLGGTAIAVVEVGIQTTDTLDLDTVARLWSIEAVGELVRAISGVLAIVIIVAIDAGADRRWAALVAPPPPPPGPPPDPGTGRLVPPPEPAVGAAG